MGLLLLVVGGQWVLYRRMKRRFEAAEGQRIRLQERLSFVKNELAAVQTRRKRLLAASTQALIIVEKDNHISSANKVAKRLFGSFEKETSFIEWTRQHQLSDLVQQTLENKKMPPVYFNRGDRVLEAHARSIKLKGTMAAVALAIHDVTELQRLTRAHRDFITNISHEVRNPLASIRLLTETLLNDGLSDRTMALNLIDKIAAQTEILGQMAQELLDLSLIESGQAPLRLALCSLKAIVQSNVDRLMLQAERKNLPIYTEVDDNITVLADETMVDRVITNLIHNAIKFTDTGGIVITAAVNPAGLAVKNPDKKEDDGDWVVVSVADTGVGLPPDEATRVFERFYKIDRSRKRPQAGTGLGLAIAKHIVEAHGGRIWAESRSGGATFHFTLPVEETPASQSATNGQTVAE